MYLSPSGKPASQAVNDFLNKVNAEMTWSNDSLVLDDHYTFNQKYFAESKAIYGGYGAKLILQTSYILPFQLPFGENAFSQPIWLTPESPCYCTFFFRSFSDRKRFLCGFLPEFGIEYETFRTRCEVVAMLRNDSVLIDGVDLHPLSAAEVVRRSKTDASISGTEFVAATSQVFDVMNQLSVGALHLLNSLIMTYAYQLNDDSAFPVEQDHLEHASHFRVIEPEKWVTYNWMRVNNTHFPQDPWPTLDTAKLGDVFTGAQHYHQHKSVLHQWWHQRAMYEWQAGSAANCIADLVASAEVLVREVLSLYMTHTKRMSNSAVQNHLEELSFKRILTTEISKVLGGRWSLKDTGAPVSDWYENVYRLRNRIMHAGYSPTPKEIWNAVQSALKFRAYIHGRIAEKSRKMPYLLVLSPATGPGKVVELGTLGGDGNRDSAS